jgi:hypothetical protein
VSNQVAAERLFILNNFEPISLRISWVPTIDNMADAPSRINSKFNFSDVMKNYGINSYHSTDISENEFTDLMNCFGMRLSNNRKRFPSSLDYEVPSKRVKLMEKLLKRPACENELEVAAERKKSKSAYEYTQSPSPCER